MRTRSAVSMVLLLVAAVLAGCGDDDDGDDATGARAAEPSSTSTSTQARSEPATVEVGDTSLGDVLVDGEGMTLYLFTRDSDGKSACSGQCAQAWPPLEADGEVTAGDGLDEDELGTITRDDGTEQVTYHGKPLYRYAPDQRQGDVTGQGLNGVWFVVKADGSAVGAGGTGTAY